MNIDLTKEVYMFIISIFMFLIGCYLIYLRSFKKNSFLYKNIKEIDWFYDLENMRTWSMILVPLAFGIGGILRFIRVLIKFLW